jgi:membrane protease YdiL (CAAX protease family)
VTIAELPALPFHRLAHASGYRWWRPIAGTALALGSAAAATVVLVIVAMAAGSLTGLPVTETGFGLGAIGDTAVALATLALLIPAVLGATRIAGRRPAGTVSSVAGRLRWRWLGLCAAVATVAVVLMLVGMQALITATGGDAGDPPARFPGWGSFGLAVGMLLTLVPLQAAAEEYLFRGLLLQAVGAFTRSPAVPVAVQALVFAAAHGWGTSWGFAALTVSGVAAGVLAVRTGGLEAYIAFHAANNLIAFTLAAAAGQLDDQSTAADMPWQLAVVSIAVDVLYTVVILALAKRRKLPRLGPIGESQTLAVGV